MVIFKLVLLFLNMQIPELHKLLEYWMERPIGRGNLKQFYFFIDGGVILKKKQLKAVLLQYYVFLFQVYILINFKALYQV